MNDVSVGTSEIVNLPSKGVVMTSIKLFVPTGESAPVLDGSKY